jgi:lipid-binding SYLF domain-containing protein
MRYLGLVLCLVLGSSALGADQNKEQARLENCGVVMQEILDVPDNIPQELLEKAECVVVIPSMTKVAVGVGGSYGRGAMVCRTGKMFNGSWGAPAMYALDGGSIGVQLGGESTDVVLLVMNNRGVDALLNSKVKLGGNASAAAGPKGRNIEASTDASLRSEILSYSRSRGLFAGVSLEGASLRPDDDATPGLWAQDDGAQHRDRDRRRRSRVRPSSRRCAGEEFAEKRIEKDNESIAPAIHPAPLVGNVVRLSGWQSRRHQLYARLTRAPSNAGAR